MWLDDDLFSRQSGLREDVAIELGRRDIDVDEISPGMHMAVNGNHAGHNSCLEARAVITAVNDRRPRRHLVQTLETQITVAIETCRRTDETLIVNRLNDRHSSGPAGIVCGR